MHVETDLCPVVLIGEKPYAEDRVRRMPPTLEWTPRLIGVLSDADRLIGRLAGEGGRLPNPHVLMRPFIRREAVLSSKIEGTQATLGELLAAEAGAAVERSPEDLREVGNYVAALQGFRDACTLSRWKLAEQSMCTVQCQATGVRDLHQSLESRVIVGTRQI
jgi:hypothetical protein